MLVRKLIEMLEDLERQHKVVEEYMGPCEIMIDVFRPKYIDSPDRHFYYAGIDGNIVIARTPDGVYPVLSSPNSFQSEVKPEDSFTGERNGS